MGWGEGQLVEADPKVQTLGVKRNKPQECAVRGITKVGNTAGHRIRNGEGEPVLLTWSSRCGSVGSEPDLPPQGHRFDPWPRSVG